MQYEIRFFAGHGIYLHDSFFLQTHLHPIGLTPSSKSTNKLSSSEHVVEKVHALPVCEHIVLYSSRTFLDELVHQTFFEGVQSSHKHPYQHEACNIIRIINILLISILLSTSCILSMRSWRRNFNDMELSLLPEGNPQIPMPIKDVGFCQLVLLMD